MRVSRRGWLWGLLGTLAVVSAVAFVAAGCGSSSSSSAASSSPSASSAPSVTVAGVPVTPDPALHQMLPASILTAGEIRVATTLPYPPWEMFVGNTTKVTGFECDLLEAVGVKLGVKVTFVNMAWASVILSLQGGKTDLIVGDMYDNTSREKQVTFVDYAYDGSSILVQKGNPQGITNLDSLAGKTVAVLSGSTQQVLLQNLNTQFKSSGKTPMQIIVLPDQPACLLAVKGGRAAADVSDHSTLEYIAMTTNSGTTFEVVTDPAAPKGYEPAIVGTAILKTNTQFVTAVQKAIQELINDGTYTTFIDKYHLIPVKSAQINVAGQAASASPTP
ncbi:MAG: ABC transporter substrate-binding protein [Thermoleophilia bacterium]